MRLVKFIIIDAAMNDLIRPALYGAKHQIYPLLKNSSTIKKNTEFVGPVCESSDTFISYNKYQKLNEGDYVCIDNIGAYGRSFVTEKRIRKAATTKTVKPTPRSIAPEPTVSDTENINLVHDDFAAFPE